MASLVLTLIGQDRPGLVSSLSEKIVAFDGNWLESRMARLAGKFAGILLVSVPETNVEALTKALQGLESQGLRVTVEKSRGEKVVQSHYLFTLELVSQDRPGIIHDISHALAELGASIEELTTQYISGSWSGENLFQAMIRLRVPEDVTSKELREILEGLANELMVDISWEESPVSATT